jgi:peptide/nickel transport system permease protein
MTETVAADMRDAAEAKARAYWPVIWRRFSRSLLNRLARGWVLALVVLAVIVPFLANSSPFTVVIGGSRQFPLFRDLTRIDLILLLNGAALLVLFLIRHRLSEWRIPFPRVVASLAALVVIVATAAALAAPLAGAVTLCIGISAALLLLFLGQRTLPASHVARRRARVAFVILSGVLVVWFLTAFIYDVHASYSNENLSFPWSAFGLLVESLVVFLAAIWILRESGGNVAFLAATFLLLILVLTVLAVYGFPPVTSIFLIGFLIGAYGLLHHQLASLDDRGRAWQVSLVYLLIVTSLAIFVWKTEYLDSRDYHQLQRSGQLQGAIFAPLPWGYADYEPVTADRDFTFSYPTRQHILGTDGNGRDALSRLLWSSRVVLAIGLISEVIALIIGVTYGSLMGYFVGRVDILGMRFVEIVESIPTLFLLITFVALYGRNLFMLMVIIGLTSWTGIARFVRAEFFRIRKLDYVAAAKAAGLPLSSILFRHMLPNGLTPVIVTFTFGVASAVGSESVLSFLGIGVEPPTPSWGSMLNEAGNPAETFRWWLAIAPGLLIFLTVFAYNIIGEGLRDAIDPRLNKME